jgi:ABC-2 type transport system permease protein
MVYAVGVPTGLLTGEVQRGTMELILSRPATKTQVYICAALPTVFGMFALALVMFAGTVVGVRLFDFGIPIPLMSFFRTAAVGGLMASAVGGIALLAAASFRRRGTAVGLTVAVLILNHFVFVFAGWWPLLDRLRSFSLFVFVDGVRIFREHAWPLDDMGVLLGVLLVTGTAGAIIWQKRDLPL